MSTENLDVQIFIRVEVGLATRQWRESSGTACFSITLPFGGHSSIDIDEITSAKITEAYNAWKMADEKAAAEAEA